MILKNADKLVLINLPYTEIDVGFKVFFYVLTFISSNGSLVVSKCNI